MVTLDEKLAEALNITNEVSSAMVPATTPGNSFSVALSEDSPTNSQFKADFDIGRDSVLRLISSGHEALEGILSVAQDSQSPRAYEVVAKLMDTISTISDKLVTLHKTKLEVEAVDDITESTKIQTQNNVFIGSTKDLQEAMNIGMNRLDKIKTEVLEIDSFVLADESEGNI